MGVLMRAKDLVTNSAQVAEKGRSFTNMNPTNPTLTYVL